MGMIPLDALEVGMVLASDVQDRNGRLLLGGGAELTGKHLMIFRTWGVIEVNIAGAEDLGYDAKMPSDVSLEDLAEARKSLDGLFMHAGLEYSFVQELLRLAAIRKVNHGVS
ncbi:MAG: hypothetical protein EHM79_15150 [Geobacter sp.]|nr:MAG: hypothetical protein EHM79_15150 [Geobacter sp.]